MLINATQQEELRVALVDDNWLYDLDIETSGKEQNIDSVYKATVVRIEPSLEALFVNYGAQRHGFLPFREVVKSYLKHPDQKLPIKDQISVGQEIIIQVDKEARGNKGAAITTYISLAGCYLVLMPNNPKAGGISRRIEGGNREELKEIMEQVEVPEGMGVIARTAGVGRSIEELQWDLNVLQQQWQAILEASKSKPAPFLIYQESSLIVRAIRDHLRTDIAQIIVDCPEIYDQTYNHIRMMRPDYVDKVVLYNDNTPLFSKYDIEQQIQLAFQREVTLPSGGAIVIDHTEALISIDINSARATKGTDIEETAYKTNLEAADEIARQLRLRDIGGLVVIDFIDMTVNQNQRDIEDRLREAMSMDRARVQIGKISRFGLLEMSRQRLRPAIAENTQHTCPRCSGQGTIRSVEALAVNTLRLIEEEAIKEKTGEVQAELPLEVATYLVNEKRQALTDLERKHHVIVVIVPNPNLVTPNLRLKRIVKSESDNEKVGPASYTLATKEESLLEQRQADSDHAAERTVQKPAISHSINNIAAPAPKAKDAGLIKTIVDFFRGDAKKPTPIVNNKQRNTNNKNHTYKRPANKPVAQKAAPNIELTENNTNPALANNEQKARTHRSKNRRRRSNNNNKINKNGENKEKVVETSKENVEV